MFKVFKVFKIQRKKVIKMKNKGTSYKSIKQNSATTDDRLEKMLNVVEKQAEQLRALMGHVAPRVQEQRSQYSAVKQDARVRSNDLTLEPTTIDGRPVYRIRYNISLLREKLEDASVYASNGQEFIDGYAYIEKNGVITGYMSKKPKSKL